MAKVKKETDACPSHGWFCEVFKTAIDGMFVIDMQGRYKDVNPAGCAMFGYGREEFLRSDISLLMFPEDVPAAFERGKTSWRKGRFAPEVRMRKKDGAELWVELTTNPFRHAGVDYCLGIKRDITAQKRLNEELDAKIKERTKQLEKTNELLSVEIEDRRKAEDALRIILEGTSSVAGEDFARSLVKNLATALKFRYACIGEVTDEAKDRIRMLAMWDNGKISAGMEYGIKGTPCGNVVGKQVCFYPSGVQRLFPEDGALVDMRAESYIGVPLFDGSGKPLGILSAMDDKPMAEKPDPRRIISVFASRAALELERQRFEAELKKTTAMLSAIMDNSQAVIYLKDEEGRFAFVNRHYQEIFNKDSGEITGKTDYDLFPKDMADAYRENDARVFEANAPLEFEETAIHPDGTTRTYLSLKFTIPGVPGSICGISTDITGMKRSSEELKRSEELLKQAQHVAKLGSWERDLATNKVRWSDEVYDIFGVKRGEFNGTFEALKRLIHPDDLPFVISSVEAAVRGKKAYNVNYRIITPAGELKTLHAQGEVVCDASGAPARVVGTAQDVTEIRRMQEEAVKAQKLESIGILAGGIAHDFNNLLVGVLGSVGIVKHALAADGKILDAINDIEHAALRARGLTKKLLTFSRGGEPVRQTAHVAGLIHNTAAFAVRDTDMTIDFSFPEDLSEAEIDEGQIAQVINNIVMNAVHAMGGNGTIHISAENADVNGAAVPPLKPGRYIKISIKDSGVGIAEENIPNVFDPFFTTKVNGAGLGLAVAYSVVKKHGGTITVKSAPGMGSTFCVYLPSAVPADACEAEEGAEVVRGKGRILVMDDEDVVREVSGDMLRLLGYEPEFAVDGVDALGKYKKAAEEGRPFDLVIMDLTVAGGMGGKEAVARLLERYPDARAVVSSGYSNDPVMSGYAKHGFKGVISKPYTVSALSRVVGKVLGRG